MQTGVAIAVIVVIALGLALPFIPKNWYSWVRPIMWVDPIKAHYTDSLNKPNEPDDEDLSLAALYNLWPLPTPSAIFPKTDGQLDRVQQWVDTKRKWAQTLEDGRVQKAYEHWLVYVERGIRENREENVTHKHRNELEEWSRKNDEKRDRANAVAGKIAKPPE